MLIIPTCKKAFQKQWENLNDSPFQIISPHVTPNFYPKSMFLLASRFLHKLIWDALRSFSYSKCSADVDCGMQLLSANSWEDLSHERAHKPRRVTVFCTWRGTTDSAQ